MLLYIYTIRNSKINVFYYSLCNNSAESVHFFYASTVIFIHLRKIHKS